MLFFTCIVDHIEEISVALRREVEEKEFSRALVEAEIALIVSREAVRKDHIIARMPAKSCKVWRAFRRHVQPDPQARTQTRNDVGIRASQATVGSVLVDLLGIAAVLVGDKIEDCPGLIHLWKAMLARGEGSSIRQTTTFYLVTRWWYKCVVIGQGLAPDESRWRAAVGRGVSAR